MKVSTLNRIMMVFLSVLILINIYVMLRDRGILEVKVNRSLASMDEAINALTQPEDGETPIKGVHYFDGDSGETGPPGPPGRDGRDGQDGNNSTSTHTSETIIREVPVNGKDGYTPVKGVDYFDGKTPILRCNVEKNRWEMQYNNDKNWNIIRNENNESAICRPTNAIILP